MSGKSAQAVIESGEEEALVGGFQKNPFRRQLDERPGKNKTPRRQDLTVIEPEEAQAQATQEKNLEGEMKNNESLAVAATQTRPEFEICPLCGFFNKSTQKTTREGDPIHYLVCKGCDDKYNAYAKRIADEIIAGKKPEILSKIEWVLSQLDLKRFEKELETARQIRSNGNLNERVAQKIKTAAGDKALPREVFSALESQYREEISKEDYFLVRRLFARLQAAQKLKPELEQMLAKKAAEPAPVAPVPEHANV